MKIWIQEIKVSSESRDLIITAIVESPSPIPAPKTDYTTKEFQETDEQYQERIKPNALEHTKFNNLHIGEAYMNQEVEIFKPSHMEEYWS